MEFDSNQGGPFEIAGGEICVGDPFEALAGLPFDPDSEANAGLFGLSMSGGEERPCHIPTGGDHVASLWHVTQNIGGGVYGTANGNMDVLDIVQCVKGDQIQIIGITYPIVGGRAVIAPPYVAAAARNCPGTVRVLENGTPVPDTHVVFRGRNLMGAAHRAFRGLRYEPFTGTTPAGHVITYWRGCVHVAPPPPRPEFAAGEGTLNTVA